MSRRSVDGRSIDEANPARPEFEVICCAKINWARSSKQRIKEFLRHVVSADGILEREREFVSSNCLLFGGPRSVAGQFGDSDRPVTIDLSIRVDWHLPHELVE